MQLCETLPVECTLANPLGCQTERKTHPCILSSMIVLSNMSGSNIEQISFPLCCGEQNGHRTSLSSGTEPYGTMQKSVLWKAVFGTE